jgi:hypothetical protein
MASCKRNEVSLFASMLGLYDTNAMFYESNEYSETAHNDRRRSRLMSDVRELFSGFRAGFFA